MGELYISKIKFFLYASIRWIFKISRVDLDYRCGKDKDKERKKKQRVK